MTAWNTGTAGLLAAAAVAHAGVAPLPAPNVPVPNARQLEFMEMEFVQFMVRFISLTDQALTPPPPTALPTTASHVPPNVHRDCPHDLCRAYGVAQ